MRRSQEAATVTITKTVPTGGPTTVTMTLSATLEGKAPIPDSMTIDVYDDACQAALAIGQATIDPADFNADCTTDLEDVLALTEKWLWDFSITEPVVQ